MTAVARAGDPGTSWEAARSLDEAALRRSQRIVLRALQEVGPMTDEQLCAELSAVMSPSGTRTRRSELVDKSLVYDTGERVRLISGRRAIVWAARSTQPTLW
jgi:hypothetical protein